MEWLMGCELCACDEDMIMPCVSTLDCFVRSTLATASLTLCDNRTNTPTVVVKPLYGT